jgi:putative FmdB family regulatory protein
MPTYEYRCQDCRDEIEVQQSFSDDALTECPSCGGLLKKKFSSPGISFKGSGFYKTDSRSGSSSAKKESKEPSTESAPSSSESSTAKSDKSDKSDSTAKKPDTSSSTPAAASA